VGCSHQPRYPQLHISYFPPPSTNIVATIAGEDITEEALINQDRLSFYELDRRRYDLRKATLQEVLIKKLVGAKAAEQNMDIDAYTRDFIWKSGTNITQAEFETFVRERNIPEGQLNDPLRQRITAYLVDQKKERVLNEYLAQLTRRVPVKVYFKKPRMALDFDLPKNTPVCGNELSHVTLIELIDFEAPFTARGVAALAQIRKDYGSKIRIACLFFPLPFHHNAHAAAEVAMAIAEKDKNAFWEFCDTALTNHEHLEIEDLARYANKAGVDAGECLKSRKYAPLVDEQLHLGEHLGARSSPTFLINGEWISGMPSVEELSESIESALEDTKIGD
jgi:protein-disulfide isomerase